MSQSPLARSTRRSLPAFAHTPSRLSKATSSRDIKQLDQDKSQPSPSLDQNGHITPSKLEFSLRQRHDYDSSSEHITTPKIHYSPFATSTPPGQLSRSSSIPFDMAASAKASRKAEEEARAKVGTTTPGAQRKRFIRRKTLLQR